MTTPRVALLGLLGATAVHCAVPRCPDATQAAATNPELSPTPSVAPTAIDGSSDNGGAPPGRGLSPEPIRLVVLASLKRFQACYEIEVAKDPDLKGGVTIAFQVGTDGIVTHAQVASTSLGNTRVEGCMVEVLKELRFAAAEKPTRAVFPFLFKPR